MRRVLVCLVFLALAGSTAAQERTHDITPADYLTVNTITELAVSPDGKQVAYCLASWKEATDDRKTDLWVVPTDGKGKPRQLTSDRASDRTPKWAADGKSIYVLANRKGAAAKTVPGGAQVWRVPLDGKPEPVTKAVGGVVAFDYAPKADAVFYTTDRKATDTDDFTALREKFTRPDYGHGKQAVSVLWRLPADGKAERVMDKKRYIRDFAVTRDGKRVAMITAPDDTVIQSEGNSRVDVLDVQSGKVTTTDQSWKKTAGSPWPWLGSLAWNPDGTRLAYCTIFDAYPAEIIVCEEKGGKWPARRLDRGENPPRGYGSPLVWRSPTVLGYLYDHYAVVGFMEYDLQNPKSSTGTFNTGEVPAGFAFLPSAESGLGRKVAILGRVDRFSELCRIEPDENAYHPLTDLNPHTATWKLPTVHRINWIAPDDTRVGGVLELPYGYKKGEKKLPLVVAIHGGPTTASHADLEFDPHNGRLYFSAKGYAVLCPNYRGSTGYGDKFVTDLIGHENDIEVKDILAGIQHLITEGIVDPDRVAVMGWSNGGYLTNCLITLKDSPVKFKAASSGAGILDTVAEWGFNDEPAYPRVFKKGLPWETPDIYRKTSPTYGLGNVTTPTLIHVGGNDPRCPPGHSRMLYRALNEYVKVPTELLVYPGEPHGLTKLSNRRAKMEWDLAWFQKYVMQKK